MTRKKWKRKRRRGWIPDDVRIAQQITAQYSLEVSSFDEYIIALQHNFHQWNVFARFYLSKNNARNRWYHDQRKDSTYSHIANRLISDDNTLIVFGNAYQGHRAWKGTNFGDAPVK